MRIYFLLSAVTLVAMIHAGSSCVIEEVADDGGTSTAASGGSTTTASVGGGGSGGDPGPNKSAVCDELGLPSNNFLQADGGSSFGKIAGDFTAQTLRGPWNFAENFSGCESYVFINFYSSSHGQQLWSSNPADLLAHSAKNVHYFFGSYSKDEATRSNEIEQMKG